MTILMAVSTALVGPLTFLGFLVAMLTYQIADTHHHRYMFPMAVLAGFVILTGAYFVLNNVFYAEGAVSIIIEAVGGSAFLRHENHFVTRLTVRQLVGFGRFPYSKGRLTPYDEEIISRSIEFFDLADLEHRFLDQLSGGQRQRAYVAMVLCQDTDYLLLDEPLNNLDMRHSVQMMRHLRGAADELGRTVVIVLHDINFASHYSDRICMMKDGKVVEFGTPKEVMVAETLTRYSIHLWNASMGRKFRSRCTTERASKPGGLRGVAQRVDRGGFVSSRGASDSCRVTASRVSMVAER